MRAAVAVLSLLLLAAAVRSGGAAQGDALRIGTYVWYPPWTVQGDSGAIEGFEPDLTAEVCRRIGRACEMVPWDWEDVIPALLRGDIDMIVSQMTATPERAERIRFTGFYTVTPTVFAARRDGDLARLVTLRRVDLDALGPDEAETVARLVEALRGRRVGVHVDTTQLRLLEERFGLTEELVLYRSEEEKWGDLAAGRIDALVDNATVHAEMIASFGGPDRGIVLFGPSVVGGPIGRGQAIGLRPDDTALHAAVDGALETMRADGSLAVLAIRWFGYDATPQ
jgi:octopine/nopaline transport system substrate-binding protein